MLDTKGLFIVFEGLDGSGTSTQARLLKEALSRERNNVFMTSEPTNGPVGQLIRLAMSHRLIFASNEQVEDHQLAYLFAADRHDHLHNSVDGVLLQLASEAIVISTRYYLSSFAYHCRDDKDFQLVTALNSKFPPADITFYIDCPIDVCLDRISKRQFLNEKYEHKQKLLTVRENYARAIESYTGVLHSLNGDAPVDALHQQIISIVRQRLCQ